MWVSRVHLADDDHTLQHGNEPSKGAKIDEALEAEDQAILAKKDGKN